MAEKTESIALRASEFSLLELHARLRSCEPESSIALQVEHPLHGIGAGLDHAISISIDGNVGDFAFMLSETTHYDVNGNAGVCCGHSLSSGSVLLRGSAGDCLGAFATGGFLAVHSHSGKRCAMELAGADVFVRSSVGNEAGYCMRDGALVLGNGAGENVGLGMTGGIIYIRGDVKSVASNARQMRMKDAEALRLSLFLARAGIKGGNAEFKVYRAK